METNRPPLISVILSTYNHLEYLPKALGTILDQTFINFMEIIVIDDGSTDGTWEYLKELKTYIKPSIWIKFFKHDINKGIQKSYEEGFKLASGDFLTFVSADNIHRSDMIEKLARPLIDNPEIVFSYSAFEWIDAEEKIFKKTENQYLGPHALLIDNPGMACFMYRREIIEEIGHYDPEIGPAMDTDMWLRVSEKYGLKRMFYVSDALCQFRFDMKCKSYEDLISDRIRGSIKKMVEKAVIRRKQVVKEKTPRVLFVVPNFLPDWYAGVEVYTYNLAKEIIRRGGDISVLYRQMGDPGIVESSFDGIKVYNIVSNSSLIDIKLMTEDPEMESLFIKFLDQVPPFEIFHFHHTMGLPFSIINIPKRCGYPVVLTLHDFWFMCRRMYLYKADNEICEGPESTDKCVTCLLRKQEKFVDEVSSAYYHLSYLNMSVKLWMQDLDLITVPSQFVVDRFKKYGYRVDIISALGIPSLVPKKTKRSEKIVFGYFGIINKIKNVTLIVEAFKDLLEQLGSKKEVELLIWGTGSDEDITKLKKEIGTHERIRFYSSYKFENLSNLSHLIDCMVIASQHETYSLTVREALSLGIPVISSNVGAIPEILIDEYNGLLFHSNHKDELVDEMLRIVESKSLLNGLKKNARDTSIYSIEDDARIWMERYKNLILI